MSLSVLSLTGDQQIAVFGVLIGGLFLSVMLIGALHAVCMHFWRQCDREAAFLRQQIRGVGAAALTVTPSLDETLVAHCYSPLGHPDLVPGLLPAEPHCFLRDAPGWCACRNPSRQCERRLGPPDGRPDGFQVVSLRDPLFPEGYRHG